MNNFANWRALVPSWKFFDEIGPGFELQFRLTKNSQDLAEDWQWAKITTARRPWSLFFNPQQNLIFALDSLVDRIVIETQSHDSQTQFDFEKSVTYGLMLNWARRCAKNYLRTNHGQIGESARVQFRVCTRATAHQAAQHISNIQVVLLSMEHPV